MAAALGLGVFTLSTAPAGAAEKASVQKCDKGGKVCTAGKNCKATNCKTPKKGGKK
jgi:hypothetical protein